MNKEQIEEMARSCCSRTYKTCEECIKESEKIFGKTDIDDCECYSYARRFFNKGYRKTIWHKVAEDDLPKEDCEVIFVSDTGYHYGGIYVKITDAFYADGDTKYDIDEVIAWTELPKYEEQYEEDK